jgi:hypothetical protein
MKKPLSTRLLINTSNVIRGIIINCANYGVVDEEIGRFLVEVKYELDWSDTK